MPPKPKEFTPITGSAPGRGSGAVGTRIPRPAKSIRGFGVPRCRFGGITRLSSISSALSSPAMPEAVSRWPIFDFTEPTGSGEPRSPALGMTSASPIVCASTGSPAWVPVPWASK